MDAGKVQVVFLLDTCAGSAEHSQLHVRSLGLACIRILLFLTQFPFKEHRSQVTWNYKLFNSRRPERTVRTRTAQFSECRSELLQKLFQELERVLEDKQPHVHLSEKPAKLVYDALASAVQDFVWDAPEITSPVRPVYTKSGTGKKKPTIGRGKLRDNTAARNLIFVCSHCPQSKEEVREFCGGLQVDGDSSRGDLLTGVLLPRALLSQLASKGIAVHWVDMCGCHGNSHPLVCMYVQWNLSNADTLGQ